jgi:hypothetical protein
MDVTFAAGAAFALAALAIVTIFVRTPEATEVERRMPAELQAEVELAA